MDEFDEEAYLRKYQDVAHAVKAGRMPSGEHHYLHHGKREGRFPGPDVVLDRCKLWLTYKKYAPFYEDIDDFDLFNELMDKIRNGDNFHIARYNDGEWVCMLRIAPHFSQLIRRHGHNPEEFTKISEVLLAIIDSVPQYYIGIDSNTRAERGLIVTEKLLYREKIEKIDKIIYGDIFNAATIRFGIGALFNPLKERYTISVGPAYMAQLGASAHAETPFKNCWAHATEIEAIVDSLIDKNITKNPVVVYSCSLLAKVLVDIFYNKYGNKISQLDIGSCIDPWCGINSRPWHIELINHYQLNTVKGGAIYRGLRNEAKENY